MNQVGGNNLRGVRSQKTFEFQPSRAMTLLSPIQTVIRSNLAVIQQGVELLAALGGERYAKRIPLCYNASVGGHVRHIIEHYQAFLHGLEDGEIDYEKRVRDPLVENDPAYASGLLESIAQQLEERTGTLGNATIYFCAETTPGI